MINEYKLKQVNPVNTATQWQIVNPVLFKGEIAFESDTKRYKVGDGYSSWNDLPYGRGTNTLIQGEGVTINNQGTISAILLYDVVEPNG